MDVNARGGFLSGSFPTFTPLMKESLSRKYTADEVHLDLKDMGALKAPGQDGFQAIFF